MSHEPVPRYHDRADSERRKFSERPLPVERIVFDGSELRIGAFRCPADDPRFEDSGPIDNHIFVFPRRVVRIQHEAGAPFVADPLLATLYNRGQRYRREPVGRQPDFCDWFALSPSLLDELTSSLGIPVAGDGPFATSHVPTPRAVFLRQRRLFLRAEAGLVDGLEATEAAVAILSDLLVPAAIECRVTTQEQRLAEKTRACVAERFVQNDSLADIGRAVGASSFHMSRTFRRVFGRSIGEYREEHRLRAAMERLASRESLGLIALDLGYSSHAHFTYRFRRALGVTPRGFRRSLA